MSKKERRPSGNMDFQRRDFFKRLFYEARSIIEAGQGKQQMKLNRLDKVDEMVFKQMVPVVFENCHLKISGDQLMVKYNNYEDFRMVCELNELTRFIFERFNGSMSVDDISSAIETEFNLTQSEAYEQVRSLFLLLALRMICHPAHAHCDIEGVADNDR